jgi:hypothetical protein
MKKTQTQQEQLRAARKVLKKTNAELAAEFRKSEAGILAWLAPKTSAKHRTMPAGARLLLARIVADAKRKK